MALTFEETGTCDGRAALVAAVEVRDLQGAETAWRRLEAVGERTPNHAFDWMECWQRHLGRRCGVEPAVLIGTDAAGEPLFVWPFGLRRRFGVTVASWLGGRFANYQMGLYAPDAMRRLGPADLARAFGTLRADAGVQVLRLINQPRRWNGVANPLLALPHRPAPSQAYSVRLAGQDFDALYRTLASARMRRKLARSERRIAERDGSCMVRQPGTADEAAAVIDVFLQQKRQRMAETGGLNAFESAGVEDFLHELARRSASGTSPLLELFWLQNGSRVGATWAGVGGGSRLSGLFNSFDGPALAACHPGEVLIRHVMEAASRRGYAAFDLGTGDAAYKRNWCPHVDELFETHLALDPRGLGHTLVAGGVSGMKRRLKASPVAMKALRRLGPA